MITGVFQWEWCANSLNPDHEGNSLLEMIPDDRLLRHTYKNWYFGADLTGNITKYYNHTDLLQKLNQKASHFYKICEVLRLFLGVAGDGRWQC